METQMSFQQPLTEGGTIRDQIVARMHEAGVHVRDTEVLSDPPLIAELCEIARRTARSAADFLTV